MVPSTLQIITGGIRAESRLSLRHVERILQVMPGKTCLNDISMAICYVTKTDCIPIVKEEWKYARTKYVRSILGKNKFQDSLCFFFIFIYIFACSIKEKEQRLVGSELG
jgi:hypothetical protein